VIKSEISDTFIGNNVKNYEIKFLLMKTQEKNFSEQVKKKFLCSRWRRVHCEKIEREKRIKFITFLHSCVFSSSCDLCDFYFSYFFRIHIFLKQKQNSYKLKQVRHENIYSMNVMWKLCDLRADENIIIASS
jgi:hypothetical protein